MSRRSALSMIRSAIGPALASVVIGYFAFAAIAGRNGLLSLAGYRAERAEKVAVLHDLQAERDRLAHHAMLLNPRHVDPDLADEIVRKQTGLIRPDEVILPAK